jgi:hypothetical protein
MNETYNVMLPTVWGKGSIAKIHVVEFGKKSHLLCSVSVLKRGSNYAQIMSMQSVQIRYWLYFVCDILSFGSK